MDTLNVIFAMLSIGLGCFGWLAPHYTMAAIDLISGSSDMGTSEIRASVGCLFVGMGLGALILGSAEAYTMLGFCWVGAAVGRLTSLALDGQSKKKWIYFSIETGVGLPAILLNM